MPVESIPTNAKNIKKYFFLLVRSANAPKNGAIITITSPAIELAVPKYAVDVASSKLPPQ